jgi:phosphonate transport system ATP-binding protein
LETKRGRAKAQDGRHPTPEIDRLSRHLQAAETLPSIDFTEGAVDTRSGWNGAVVAIRVTPGDSLLANGSNNVSSESSPPAETEQGRPLIRLSNVRRRWNDIEALKGVSLDIRAGEMILLAGPSGSGKSTLLRILTGALKPTSGTVEINGVDIATMTPAELRNYKRTCGIVEQGNLLVPQLSVHRNVIAGRIAHWPWYRVLLSAVWPIERERVRALLDDLGLGERQWETTANLSGGQQQRVAVARALISSPLLMIADEPTASLDAANAVHVTQRMVAAARRNNATLILCTHWVSLALPYMERLIGLRDGAVTVDCKASEFGSDLSPRPMTGGGSTSTTNEFGDEDSVTTLYEGSLDGL